MEKILYLATYSFSYTNGFGGNGEFIFSRTRKIETFEDLEEIRKLISSDQNVDNVIFSNIIALPI